MSITIIITGWWLGHPSEKYEFVSWDDFSQSMEKTKKIFQTTHQIIIMMWLRKDGIDMHGDLRHQGINMDRYLVVQQGCRRISEAW